MATTAMKKPIASLPPLSNPSTDEKLFTDNSRDVNELAPVKKPGSSNSDRRAGSNERKKRRDKMERIRKAKHATIIQASWRGAKVRKLKKLTPHQPDSVTESNNQDGFSAEVESPDIRVVKSNNAIDNDEEQDNSKKKIETDHESDSIWPSQFHDNFSFVGDSSIPWPKLTLSQEDSSPTQESVLDWVFSHHQVLIRAITWNMQANDPPPVEEVQQRLLPLNRFHIIAFGTEECERSIAQSAVNPSKKVWESYLLDLVGPNYTPLRSHTLQAIHLILFVHNSIKPLVSEISSAAVACGMANTLGNKGGVGISFRVADTKMLVINTHLSAHQNKVNDRNAQVWKILNDLPSLLSMNELENSDDQMFGQMKVGATNSNTDVSQDANNSNEGVQKLKAYFNRVIMMGDMNYRINGNRKVVDKLLQANMYEVLLSNDQLTTSMRAKELPDFLSESPVSFRPTYKFNKNSDIYDTSAKKRIPSWTDRILYAEEGLKCIAYDSVPDLRISDHRPVFATFVASTVAGSDSIKADHDKLKYTSESQVCSIM